MEFIKNIEPIVICDIGASPIEKTEFIDNLFENTNSRLIGFEPNISEFKKLINSDRKKFFNFAIGDGNEHELNICEFPGMSSFLKPDFDYLKMFHGFENWSKVIKTEKIITKKLNDLEDKFDFIKLDVQGYESEVIKFGDRKIKDALVIQIESSPIPIYYNEKPFSFILKQLEDLGFVLHMFDNINSKIFKPMVIQNDVRIGLHHLFQLDCVFIKNFDEIKKLNEEKLKKLILILFYSFRSYDLVDHLICNLEKKTRTHLIDEYRKLMKSEKIFKKY